MRTHRLASLGKLNWGNRSYVFLLLCASTAIVGHAQTFITLHDFDVKHGAEPYAGLIQATNGNFYGTTPWGGGTDRLCEYGCGTVFEITPNGALRTLHSFCSQSGCADGRRPEAGLIQATDGNLYGTTLYGGIAGCADNYGCGTIFKIAPNGTLTTLYNFCDCTDGFEPRAGLIQATDGNFYGTTYAGGTKGGGTVFRITPSGTLTTLYHFCSQFRCADGQRPLGTLFQATDGNFYGTTEGNGVFGFNEYGTVFKITRFGRLTTLYRFCSQTNCTDGKGSMAGLVQATDGNFYGTTPDGGANSNDGTIFKITPSGTLTTLYGFCSQPGCADGESPVAGLVQATDGNLYGTNTAEGITSQGGTVFKITLGGTLTTLYSFGSQSGDGLSPYAPLLQATSGSFYGTTSIAGAPIDGVGTVFSGSVGLGPFVETQTTSGMVGWVVKILGTDLTGATSVSFNGTAAVFKVVSSSLISATVPTGASTGFVTVITPPGTLTSNQQFRVTP